MRKQKIKTVEQRRLLLKLKNLFTNIKRFKKPFSIKKFFNHILIENFLKMCFLHCLSQWQNALFQESLQYILSNKIIFCITYCYHVSPAPVTVYIASPSTSQELIASFFTSTQENFFGDILLGQCRKSLLKNIEFTNNMTVLASVSDPHLLYVDPDFCVPNLMLQQTINIILNALSC